MHTTTTKRSRSPGVLLIAFCVLVTGLLVTGPAGATPGYPPAAYPPTASLLSPQAAYNTSAVNITNLAGTYLDNATRVTLLPAGYPVSLVKKGSLVNSSVAKLDGAAGVYVTGSYAYVASSASDALEIVNVATPATPAHAGSIADGSGGALLAGANSVFVHGKYAYVTSPESNALEVVNIQSPASPAHVTAFVNGSGGYANLKTPSAVFVGNYSEGTEVMAYVVSTGSNALQIIAVTNPASPQKRANISTSDGAKGNLTTPRGIFVRGDPVRGHTYAYIAVANGLEIIDVTATWGPLTQTGFLKNGTGGALLTGASSVQVAGNYAYVTSPAMKALEIVNISDPANPKHAAKIVNGTGGAWLDSPVSVAVWGTYAYVVNQNSGMVEVIDVSNPMLPQHEKKFALGSGYGAADIFVQGDMAYIASSQHKSLDLVQASTGSITATGVRAMSVYRESSRIICTLPVTGKQAGSYHVMLMNPGLQQSLLLNGFTVYQQPVIPPEPYPGWKFRGVLNGTGIYDDGGSRPNGKLLWNSTGVKFVSSTPAVVNGLVYAGDLDRYFYAIFINNGSVKWKTQLDDVVHGAPAVANGRLFVGTGDSSYNKRTFYALNAATGALLWNNTSSLGGYKAGPTVYNNMVIIAQDDGNITARNVATGKEIWRFRTSGGASTSPAISNGRLFEVTRDGNIYCIDAATGKKIWDGKSTTDNGYGPGVLPASGAAVAYGKVYVGGEYALYAVDEATGRMLYQYDIPGAYLDGTPAVAGGLVHIATTGGGPAGGNAIYTLFASNLTLKWANHTPENTVMTASPAVANGVLYITSDRANQNEKGFLYAWNAQTGAPIWSFHLPGGGTDSSPAVQDGVVYVGQWWDGFLAIGTQHPLFLTAPNGMESWQRGTTQTIRWQYNGTPGTTVKVDLLKGGVLSRVLTPSTPIGAKGSGTYSWSILANTTPAANYQIRITSGGKVDTTNGYFTIAA